MESEVKVTGYEVFRQVEEITLPLQEIDSMLLLVQDFFGLDKRHLTRDDVLNYEMNHQLLADIINHVQRDIRDMEQQLMAIKYR